MSILKFAEVAKSLSHTELESLFSPFGELLNVRAFDNSSHKWGIVTFLKRESAEEALKALKNIKLSWAPFEHGANKKLYVNNLPSTTTIHDVEKHFSYYGPLFSTNFILKNSLLSATVSFVSLEDACKARYANRNSLLGSSVTLKYAHNKDGNDFRRRDDFDRNLSKDDRNDRDHRDNRRNDRRDDSNLRDTRRNDRDTRRDDRDIGRNDRDTRRDDRDIGRNDRDTRRDDRDTRRDDRDLGRNDRDTRRDDRDTRRDDRNRDVRRVEEKDEEIRVMKMMTMIVMMTMIALTITIAKRKR